jgi:hypothetical protein
MSSTVAVTPIVLDRLGFLGARHDPAKALGAEATCIPGRSWLPLGDSVPADRQGFSPQPSRELWAVWQPNKKQEVPDPAAIILRNGKTRR